VLPLINVPEPLFRLIDTELLLSREAPDTWLPTIWLFTNGPGLLGNALIVMALVPELFTLFPLMMLLLPDRNTPAELPLWKVLFSITCPLPPTCMPLNWVVLTTVLPVKRVDDVPVLTRTPPPFPSRMRPETVALLAPGNTSTPLSKPRMTPLRTVTPVRV
jgi:hypothetical protein